MSSVNNETHSSVFLKLEERCLKVLGGEREDGDTLQCLVDLKDSLLSVPIKERESISTTSLLGSGLPYLNHVINTEQSRDLDLALCEYLSLLSSQSDVQHKTLFNALFDLYTNEDLSTMSKTHVLMIINYLLMEKEACASSHLKQDLLTRVLLLLVATPTNQSFLLSSLVLPCLLLSDATTKEAWQFVEKVWLRETNVESRSIDLCLTLLCCLVHVFIPGRAPLTPNIRSPPVLVHDVRHYKIFWDIIQSGLVDEDPLNRKRCQFLMDAVLEESVGKERGVTSEGGVFWWNGDKEKELREIWSNLMLLLETLEEKQVHIVNPVLNRLPSLVSATRTLVDGLHMLHVSWLMTVFKRVLSHDAKSIVRRGVRELLGIELSNSPFLLKENWKVILDPLLTAFGNSYVFARESHSNAAAVCPPLVEELGSFLSRFISKLGEEEKYNFFSFFLSCCLSKELPDIPTVYVMYSLTLLPPSFKAPLIGTSSIETIRSLVVNTSLIHRIVQRSATQSFILAAFCKYCSQEFSFSDVFQTLGCFSSTECLLYGSQSWAMASKLISRIARGQDNSGSLYVFLKTCIGSLVKDSTSTQTQYSLSTWLSPGSVARAVLLSADGHVTCDNKLLVAENSGPDDVLTDLLSPSLEAISSARTRVYMPVEVVMSSVKLLSTLLDNIITGQSTFNMNVKEGASRLVYKALLPWLPEILSYFQDVLLAGLHISSSGPIASLLDLVQLFSTASRCLYKFIGMCSWTSDNNGRGLSCTGFTDKAVHVLLDIVEKNQVIEFTVPLLGAVSVLEWVCNHGNENPSLMPTEQYHAMIRKLYNLPVTITLIRPVQHAPGQEYGRCIASCLSSYWSILHNVTLFKCHDTMKTQLPLTDHVTIGSRDVELIAKSCTEHFDVLGSDMAWPLGCLATLVPQIVDTVGVAYLLPIIEMAWPLVLELKEHLFPLLKSLRAFVQFTYHQRLMEASDPDLIQLQIKYANEIFAVSEVKTGVCNVLAEHLCTVFKTINTVANTDTNQTDIDSNDIDFTDIDSTDIDSTNINARLAERAQIITYMCGFGPIFKKNLRVILDVNQFVMSLGESCSTNSLKLREAESDMMVRVRVMNMLLEVSSYSTANTPSIVSIVIRNIVNELKELSISKPHYYINSYSHRYRLRLVQTLLVLYKSINKAVVKSVIMEMLDCLEIDNQLSVRYAMEWLVVMLMSQFPFSWKELLLPHLQMNTGRRLSRFCSIFTITVQLGKCLTSTAEKVEYYSLVLPIVFQWSLCHHFIVRLYAAGSVIQLYEQSLSLLPDIPSLSFIHQFIPFIKQYSDTGKSRKLESNVFFSLMHPQNDFNLQVIFHTLPALTSVMEEELIPFKLFVSSSCIWSQLNPPFPTTCTNAAIIDAAASLLGHSSIDEDCEIIDRPNTQQKDEDSGSDIQRKITPWNSSTVTLYSELFPSSSVPPSLLPSVQDEKKKKDNGLVLVASLINKQPNLGGLCRTCEIFGVAELVLGSTAVLEEKEFKSLSVTAEKWLKISQVKPSELSTYLLSMRRKGYTLVGVEQTAHSKQINNYQIPVKTVLLLGNEREGIPVELIHSLDECVEIPQFGVIRSLNVHVSGAIVVWEYTKQHSQL
ncbi:PREDICTED: probable methyltransferase TARBP1 [Amphimedon queenslandica]|uniref:tRNA (guanosine(18)-2'-O)-methyltransferase TARBP1 n=1 Tax=Amphimedon queenslandica TaxID=400682 RepID=A0A1X7VLR0_AMPQE|nr:PREDICTED: probable methyltransferase TARBP1 [Amphimedon queenslandica]|eukprot:XP_019864279.1 PREDICTED: probable methyltransferase TARBP1 [Amphimedon queenslandica]